tara:strand:+ start:505 stop:783 length:279 start_codon:yes stop_codon:yes gene_type:complete
MVFNCYICNNERVYTQYYCEDCSKIRRIIDVYGKKKIRSILEDVCLRNNDKQELKRVEVKKAIEEGSYDNLMKELTKKITLADIVKKNIIPK